MIVVKGKMPKCCGTCEASGTGACGIWMKNKDLQTIAQDCPIVGEMPDKHGALIDRDKLLLAMVVINSLDDEAKDLFLEAVQNSPVILEATE